jgi:peptide/nickel transport system permease protein
MPSPQCPIEAVQRGLSVTAPATAPTAAELAALPRGESQWAIIGREFHKRRSAVWSYRAILLLAVISIFAPFLANDRPIAYRGWNPNEYNEARKAASALIGQLASPPVDAKGRPQEIDRAAVLKGALGRLAEMQRVVAPAQGEQFARLAGELGPAGNGSNTTELRRIQSAVAALTSRKMEFVPRWRFPVIATLNGFDIGFMLLAMLFVASRGWLWIASRRARGPVSPNASRVTWAIVVGVPVVAGLIWWLVVPQQNDLTQYKRGALAANETSVLQRAPVVYDGVLWPPIPFGLDENDLDAKKVPAPWWWNQERAKPRAESQFDNGLPPTLIHWLGTDNLGRDLACRMIWGGRVSLAVGVVAVAIYVAIGVVIGAVAGYFRGGVDMVISRIIEIVICFPSFFLILAIVAFVGQSMFVIMVVIGLTSWTGVARLVRAEFLRLSEQEFVLAGRVLGYSPLRLIFRHVLPNAMAPVLVSATFGVAGAILTESALSFLGLGITVPKPSWGGILSDGRDNIFSGEWIIVFPGLAIFLTITFYNLVGEAFRDAADPRLRGSR